MKLLQTANSNIPRTIVEKQDMINNAAKAYGEFLTALGFDWEKDENSKDTPKRVAKAWVKDLISGTNTEPPDITAFPSNDYDGLVFEGNIDIVSLCSHHNLPFTGKAHIAYIPGTKVIGLSKLNRIADWFARRPQIQEGLTMQIHNHVDQICEQNRGVAVLIQAGHGCVSCRGIKQDSTMITSKLSGVFIDNNNKSRDEFYSFINQVNK
jgi:GTP cyclohydrolase I